MATNSNLTYNYQTACQHLSSSYTSRPSLASPYSLYPPVVASTPTPRPATLSQLRDPPVCDLFATLLFDRQRAYQSRSCVPSALPSAPVAGVERTKSTERKTGTQIQHTPPISSKLHVQKEEETQAIQYNIPLPSNLKPAMVSKTSTVSRKRARPAKQTPIKDAGKTTTVKSRECATPTRMTTRMTTKRQKTEANSTKKIDDKSNMNNSLTTAWTTTSYKDREVIVIHDSEDEGHQPMRERGIGQKEGEDAESRTSKINNDHEEDDVKPSIPTPAASSESFQLAPIVSPSNSFDQAPRRGFDVIDLSESHSDLHPGLSRNNLQKDMTRVETEHTKEKEQLRQELDAAKAELDRVKRLHEKEESESKLMQVRSSDITRQEIQRLQHELETEKTNLRATVTERDQLRVEVNDSRARSDQLTEALQEEKRLRESERKEHEKILQDVTKFKEPTSDPSNDFLSTENERLRTENITLRAAAAATRAPPTPPSVSPPVPFSIFTPPSSQQFQISPHASIFACEHSSVSSSVPPTTIEERKKENVRKNYTILRRRFDSLYAVAGKLSNATRGMDLSSFGEFGQYVRQLRAALDDDGKKEDEDAKVR